MAKYSANLKVDFDEIVQVCDVTIMKKSISAQLEDASYFENGDVKVMVKVYERYSAFGKNRVSINLTFVKNQNYTFVTAITTGGSQAIFFKINTFGENNFLNTLIPILESYEKV